MRGRCKKQWKRGSARAPSSRDGGDCSAPEPCFSPVSRPCSEGGVLLLRRNQTRSVRASVRGFRPAQSCPADGGFLVLGLPGRRRFGHRAGPLPFDEEKQEAPPERLRRPQGRRERQLRGAFPLKRFCSVSGARRSKAVAGSATRAQETSIGPKKPSPLSLPPSSKTPNPLRRNRLGDRRSAQGTATAYLNKCELCAHQLCGTAAAFWDRSPEREARFLSRVGKSTPARALV